MTWFNSIRYAKFHFLFSQILWGSQSIKLNRTVNIAVVYLVRLMIRSAGGRGARRISHYLVRIGSAGIDSVTEIRFGEKVVEHFPREPGFDGRLGQAEGIGGSDAAERRRRTELGPPRANAGESGRRRRSRPVFCV